MVCGVPHRLSCYTTDSTRGNIDTLARSLVTTAAARGYNYLQLYSMWLNKKPLFPSVEQIPQLKAAVDRVMRRGRQESRAS